MVPWLLAPLARGRGGGSGEAVRAPLALSFFFFVSTCDAACLTLLPPFPLPTPRACVLSCGAHCHTRATRHHCSRLLLGPTHTRAKWTRRRRHLRAAPFARSRPRWPSCRRPPPPPPLWTLGESGVQAPVATAAGTRHRLPPRTRPPPTRRLRLRLRRVVLLAQPPLPPPSPWSEQRCRVG